ncbi:SDR family NAD(P)-dependent oxidoreductase [Chloroflexota bacterium]
MKLKDKVAIVTGSGHGLGHEIALAYAKEGAALVLVARSQNEIEAVANEVRAFGGKALAIPTDVSVEEQVYRMVQKTVDEFGRIDILVNNAGGPLNSYSTPMWDLALSDWQAVLDVNLTGTFLCSKAVLTHMMRQNSGVIINMSSGMGKRGKMGMSAYSAAKFAVEGLTQSMALETSAFNIRVNALDPGGLTATPGMIKKNLEKKPDQMLQPAIISEVAVYLASGESVGVTGQSFTATIWNLDRQQIRSLLK